MNVHSKKNSCRAVSEIVEAHVRQADAYQKSPENFPQGARAKVAALGVGKHQIFIDPGATNLAPLLFLLCFVTFEDVNNKDRQLNHPAAFCCLWFRLYVAIPFQVTHCALYLKTAIFKVNILSWTTPKKDYHHKMERTTQLLHGETSVNLHSQAGHYRV